MLYASFIIILINLVRAVLFMMFERWITYIIVVAANKNGSYKTVLLPSVLSELKLIHHGTMQIRHTCSCLGLSAGGLLAKAILGLVCFTRTVNQIYYLSKTSQIIFDLHPGFFPYGR